MSEQESTFIVVLITTSSEEEAERLAFLLVENRLAACCNILKGVNSIYKWKGKTEKSAECLMLVKTRRSLFDRLASEVSRNHSYEVPEIIALPIEEGFPDYLNWMMENTRSEEKKG